MPDIHSKRSELPVPVLPADRRRRDAKFAAVGPLAANSPFARIIAIHAAGAQRLLWADSVEKLRGPLWVVTFESSGWRLRNDDSGLSFSANHHCAESPRSIRNRVFQQNRSDPDYPQLIPIPRFFPKSNDTDAPRTTPPTIWPRWRSSAARHGTSVNSLDFSMTANLPLASRSGLR